MKAFQKIQSLCVVLLALGGAARINPSAHAELVEMQIAGTIDNVTASSNPFPIWQKIAKGDPYSVTLRYDTDTTPTSVTATESIYLNSILFFQFTVGVASETASGGDIYINYNDPISEGFLSDRFIASQVLPSGMRVNSRFFRPYDPNSEETLFPEGALPLFFPLREFTISSAGGGYSPEPGLSITLFHATVETISFAVVPAPGVWTLLLTGTAIVGRNRSRPGRSKQQEVSR